MQDISALSTWPSLFWKNLCWQDFSKRANGDLISRTVAILPVGAVEQHGPHLPLGVDAQITAGIVQTASQLLSLEKPEHRPPVLFLPEQDIGFSPEHTAFPGTLTLESQTIINLWCEIGAGVARSGVRRMLIFNSHGGQVSVMDMVARLLRQRHGLLTYSSSWYQLPQPDDLKDYFDAHELRFGIHAGAQETAIMQHLHPELVRQEQIQNFPSSSEQRAKQYRILGNGQSAKMGWMMQDYNALGAAGDARQATSEKGAKLINNAAKQLIALLHEISQLELTVVNNSTGQ